MTLPEASGYEKNDDRLIGIKVPDLELAVQLAMCAGLMPQVPVRVILLALHSQLVLECDELCTYGVIWMF